MPVPNTMADLSNVAGDNYPVGSEPIGNQLDNYLRAHAALIRQGNALASQSMASGSTVSVANANGESVLITGDATITSLGAGYVGCKRELRFSGSPTLAHSSSLQLPDNADISAEPGMVLKFRCIANNTWVYTGGTYTPPLDADIITDGIFPVERGGLGVDELEAGHFLVGNGTGPVQTRSPEQVLSDIGAAPLSSPNFSGPVSISGGNPERRLSLSDGTDDLGGIQVTGGSQGTRLYSAGIGISLRPNGWNSSTGEVRLTSAGNVTVSGNITASNVTATSDARLKDSILPAKPRAELLRVVQLYRFLWKSTGKAGIGTLAQDVQKVAPEYVHEAEGGTLSVNYAGLALEIALALAETLEAR